MMSRTGFLFNVARYSKRNDLKLKQGEDYTPINSQSALGKFLNTWLYVPKIIIALPFVINFVFYDQLETLYLSVTNTSSIGLVDLLLITGLPLIIIIGLMVFMMSLLLPKEYQEIISNK